MDDLAISSIETRRRAALKESKKRDRSQDTESESRNPDYTSSVLGEAETEAVRTEPATMPIVTGSVTGPGHQALSVEPGAAGQVAGSASVDNTEENPQTSGPSNVPTTASTITSDMFSILMAQLKEIKEQSARSEKMGEQLSSKIDQQSAQLKSEIKEQSAQFQSKFEELKDQVAQQETRVLEKVAALREQFTEEVKQNREEITSVRSQVVSVETRVDSITEHVQSLDSRIDNVSVEVNSRVDKVDQTVETVQNRIGVVSGRVDDITATVNGVTAAVTGVQSALEEVVQRITSIEISSTQNASASGSSNQSAPPAQVCRAEVNNVRSAGSSNRRAAGSCCGSRRDSESETSDSAFEEENAPRRSSQSRGSNRSSRMNRDPAPDFDYNHFLTIRKFKVFRNAPGGIHPRAWIDQFDFALPPNWPEGHKIEFVCGHLEGEPASRLRSYPRNVESYESFRQHFLSAYWSDIQQDRVRQGIQMMPPFVQTNFASPSQFFQEMLARNHYLSNPYPVPELIRICLGKLPRRLRNALLAARCKDDMEQFQALLEELDFDYDERQEDSAPKQNNKNQAQGGERSGDSNRQSWGNAEGKQNNGQGSNNNGYKSNNRGNYHGKKRRRWNNNGNNGGYSNNSSNDSGNKRVHWERPSTPPNVEVRSPDPKHNKPDATPGPSKSDK